MPEVYDTINTRRREVRTGDRVFDPLDKSWRTVVGFHVDCETVHMQDGGVMGADECKYIRVRGEPLYQEGDRVKVEVLGINGWTKDVGATVRKVYAYQIGVEADKHGPHLYPSSSVRSVEPAW